MGFQVVQVPFVFCGGLSVPDQNNETLPFSRGAVLKLTLYNGLLVKSGE